MAARPSVDFNAIKPGHEAIDARLRNWARWCQPRGEGYPGTAAGFGLYRSSDARTADATASPPIDHLDATAIQKGVNALPLNHRFAVNWHYVTGEPARKMAKKVGETLDGLAQLVSEGRTMLLNRRV